MSRIQSTGSFAHRVTGRVEYVTPKRIIDELGPFDLDPCAAEVRPWPIAKVHLTELGLEARWRGLVFVNPPYGRSNNERAWLERLADHGSGIALIFAKPETALWQEVIWPKADAILFVAGRISFCNTDGQSTGGHFGPSALVAFGDKATKRLDRCKIPGYIVKSPKANHGHKIRP